MDSDEGNSRFWYGHGKLSSFKIGQKTHKILGTGCVLSLGIMEFYLLPGNWAFLPIATTPILLFAVLFGRYFKDTVLSDSDSHAPLMTLVAIYIGLCWYVITAPK